MESPNTANLSGEAIFSSNICSPICNAITSQSLWGVERTAEKQTGPKCPGLGFGCTSGTSGCSWSILCCLLPLPRAVAALFAGVSQTPAHPKPALSVCFDPKLILHSGPAQNPSKPGLKHGRCSPRVTAAPCAVCKH